MDKRTGLTVRLVASILCAAILLVSPGPAAYAAAGQVANVKVAAPVGMSMGMVGGSFNAATDRESTVYWARVPRREATRAIDVLGELICRPALDEDEIGWREVRDHLCQAGRRGGLHFAR